jgi:hypothetical protein
LKPKKDVMCVKSSRKNPESSTCARPSACGANQRTHTLAARSRLVHAARRENPSGVCLAPQAHLRPTQARYVGLRTATACLEPRDVGVDEAARGHVAAGEDVGHAGSELPIDQHAAVGAAPELRQSAQSLREQPRLPPVSTCAPRKSALGTTPVADTTKSQGTRAPLLSRTTTGHSAPSLGASTPSSVQLK